ncbi:hypothetical protein [Streptomyces sp. NPDC098781]
MRSAGMRAVLASAAKGGTEGGAVERASSVFTFAGAGAVRR